MSIGLSERGLGTCEDQSAWSECGGNGGLAEEAVIGAGVVDAGGFDRADGRGRSDFAPFLSSTETVADMERELRRRARFGSIAVIKVLEASSSA